MTDARPREELAQVEQEIKVIEKYLLLDPDEHPVDNRIALDPDDELFD